LQDFANEFNISVTPPPVTVPAFVMVNVANLNVRSVPNSSTNSTILAVTSYGKVWKTTGVAEIDIAGRGYWYQVSDEHGQTLWLAGWLCKAL